MREKQLAEEAKQHDPKVTVEQDGTHPVFTQRLNKALWRARQQMNLPLYFCTGPGPEEEAAAAGADRGAAPETSQGAQARV